MTPWWHFKMALSEILAPVIIAAIVLAISVPIFAFFWFLFKLDPISLRPIL